MPDEFDPDERILGEPPPPMAGTKTHAERIAEARSDETRRFWGEDERRAREARLGVPGQLIAYYTDASAVLEHIVPERQLRLSSFGRMRDPRENKDWVAYVTGGRQGGTAASLEEVAEAMNCPPPFDMAEALEAANHARQRRTKILCLTGEPKTRSPDEDFRRCYARPRMWEQYGDGHQGACVVFDRVELDSTLVSQLRALGPIWHDPVTYDNLALRGAVTGALRLDGNLVVAAGGDIAAAVARHFDANAQLLFFTKMEDYSDENETRYVVHDGRDEEFVYVDVGPSMRAVVLGEKFDRIRLAAARERCAEANVALRQIDWRSPYGPVAPPPNP
jgi:hypothetical protein